MGRNARNPPPPPLAIVSRRRRRRVGIVYRMYTAACRVYTLLYIIDVFQRVCVCAPSEASWTTLECGFADGLCRDRRGGSGGDGGGCLCVRARADRKLPDVAAAAAAEYTVRRTSACETDR